MFHGPVIDPPRISLKKILGTLFFSSRDGLYLIFSNTYIKGCFSGGASILGLGEFDP
jgi:hypothetical protein